MYYQKQNGNGNGKMGKGMGKVGMTCQVKMHEAKIKTQRKINMFCSIFKCHLLK